MRARLSSAATTTLAFVLLLLAIAAVLWGVYKQPAIVGSFATAAGAVVAVVIQRERENRREVAERHREELAPFYESLFERFKSGLDAEKPEDQAFMSELHRKLLFYGSTPVVEAWLQWMRSLPDDDEGNADERAVVALLAWEQVLFVIRRDLGHDQGSLGPGDLLRIYIYDADEALMGTPDSAPE